MTTHTRSARLSSARRRALGIALSIAVLMGGTGAFGAGSSSGGGDMRIEPSRGELKSPEQVADNLFESGVKYKEKAWEFEKKAAGATSDKKRDKYLSKAQKEYTKAIDKQTAALKTFPRHYKAANELGYALRKTGDFKKAIGAYNYALEVHPKFWEAVEYRGEAFLALGYTDHAKQAYMELFRANPELARQLMTAMDEWIAAQPKDSTTATALAAWLSERKTLARLTQDLTINNTRTW